MMTTDDELTAKESPLDVKGSPEPVAESESRVHETIAVQRATLGALDDLKRRLADAENTIADRLASRKGS